MLLQPKKTKFKKAHKGRIKKFISPINKPYHFDIVEGNTLKLFSASNARITARQIEAARISINRLIKKTGKLYIHIFPNIPVTKKPTEIRMGKGKGAVNNWICRVPAGKLLFSIHGAPLNLAEKAIKLGIAKLPVKTIIRKL
jgi:large subunit ribosomal protein L16